MSSNPRNCDQSDDVLIHVMLHAHWAAYCYQLIDGATLEQLEEFNTKSDNKTGCYVTKNSKGEEELVVWADSPVGEIRQTYPRGWWMWKPSLVQ